MLMPTWITAVGAKAQAAFSLKFSLTAAGSSVVTAEQGDVITVSFTMQRTDSNQAYTAFGYQNYIHYDLSFFEYVEDSIVCCDTGNVTVKKQDSIEYGEIIQCQKMGNTAYAPEFVVCTFQLKVKAATGSGTVCNGNSYAFDESNQEALVLTQDLQVKISDCQHTTKIKVGAQQPTCDEKGWEAYCYCNDCGLFFDENGENIIPSVPFLGGEHSFSDVLSYDENGHWYQCTECGEKSEFSAHGGGSATCKAKAKCEVCGQEYGEPNASGHTGEMHVKNQKATFPWQGGYTGDTYCAECQQLIQKGESISQWNFSEWPWWIILVGVAVLLIIGVMVCLFGRA